MQALFAAYGLPEQVIWDNGPQFTSEEFKDFMNGNHIKHILSTLYHPGWLRGSFKLSRKLCREVRVVVNPCHIFLLSYQSKPHATTNRTPNSLFLKRELRTCTQMDLLRLDSTVRVGERQLSQKCETMLWPETMEMVRSGCPVWWLNRGAHCHTQSSWNRDYCWGDTCNFDCFYCRSSLHLYHFWQL